ncbi:type 2 lanthipeptide synthetase LanM family protein [Planomonospora venezuelensis]|uniref:Type 2 lantibiotic biosynthesis protein LanM n=1 Tax=Planomonospora venezuelensis TaxID=1999 RepID=A0A841CYZ0_PLAVE|nr:type 2 lanthipeptide synthetase LanM family protein [Planomonospora venezuelensis]MBB5962509.1 type 2 lantibiotic biosynthesis protein LanM [Planomonospora venezuelensis]GIM99089.1 lanthionine synthetase [Planomonospora venezuelensis]
MAGEFDPPLDPLIGPALADLEARLGSLTGLTPSERGAILAGAALSVEDDVRRKITRVLVLELNAARLSGRLTAPDPAARWEEWKRSVAEPAFWDGLAVPYPTMMPRLATAIRNRCEAAARFAERFAADRTALVALPGAPSGALERVEFGAGDSHRGGQTVVVLHGEDGRVVYKPRSLAVDAELAGLLGHLGDSPMRVPAVVTGQGYGWAEHIGHRHCAGAGELRAFYRGMGHWLALMRLLGGSDLHAENLIAAGPHPVVVDCESLFAPHARARPSGYGQAVDLAVELVDTSVMRTGLLPGRGVALGWRGVDMSGAGALPGQQPQVELPVVLGAGTDNPRMGTERVELPPAENHPSPEPVLGRYWDVIIAGFDELDDRLTELDRSGKLEPLLAAFADCPVRAVLRSTESYAELSRMLWHPAALHDEAPARAKASALLAKMSENVPGAPGDPAIIAAEVDELCHGDIPMFDTTPRVGMLRGPADTRCGPENDLIADAAARWRARDHGLDRRVAQAALVSAYLNEGWMPEDTRLSPGLIRTERLEPRRRAAAAGIMRGVLDGAVRGADGTVTWITPVLNPTGWAVQPLSPDLYGGAHGVAFLLAAYIGEAADGRAEPVGELPGLLEAVLHTIRRMEDRDAEKRQEAMRVRPEPPGAYLGVASQAWGWLLLRAFGAAGQEALERARVLAGLLPESIEADDNYDLLSGMAGAIVPLLRLSRETGETQWAELARSVGVRLAGLAERRSGGVCWPSPRFPQGLGGLAHGATGIGWALARLAESPDGPEGMRELAEAAFAYEDALYDPDQRGWLDLRNDGFAAKAWCHGAGGIGIVAADRLAREGGVQWRDRLARAAASCWADGIGWNHTLCHGDLGCWETIEQARAAGVAPVERELLDARILGSLEVNGPVSGLARDAFAPGLLPGLGGVAYQLLRMHPECALPSVLLPDLE